MQRSQIDYIEIHFTCASIEEARRVAKALVEEKLVACANIFPEVESHYLWEGNLESEKESKVFFKTLPELFDRVLAKIQQLSSYDVPEVSRVEITRSNPAYLSWMKTILRPE